MNPGTIRENKNRESKNLLWAYLCWHFFAKMRSAKANITVIREIYALYGNRRHGPWAQSCKLNTARDITNLCHTEAILTHVQQVS